MGLVRPIVVLIVGLPALAWAGAEPAAPHKDMAGWERAMARPGAIWAFHRWRGGDPRAARVYRTERKEARQTALSRVGKRIGAVATLAGVVIAGSKLVELWEKAPKIASRGLSPESLSGRLPSLADLPIPDLSAFSTEAKVFTAVTATVLVVTGLAARSSGLRRARSATLLDAIIQGSGDAIPQKAFLSISPEDRMKVVEGALAQDAAVPKHLLKLIEPRALDAKAVEKLVEQHPVLAEELPQFAD